VRTKRRPGTALERDPGLSAPAGISQTETLYVRTMHEKSACVNATDASRACMDALPVRPDRLPPPPSARLRDCALVVAAVAIIWTSIVAAGQAADRIPAAAVLIILAAVVVLGLIGLAREEGR